MSGAGGSFQPRLVGEFDDRYPPVSLKAKSVASAVLAEAQQVAGAASSCVTAPKLSASRAAASRLIEKAQEFLALTDPDRPRD